MVRGKLRTWIGDRGFGFVRPDGGDEDLFCHVSHFPDADEASPGDVVEFAIGVNDRNGRTEAQNVRLTNG